MENLMMMLKKAKLETHGAGHLDNLCGGQSSVQVGKLQKSVI